MNSTAMLNAECAIQATSGHLPVTLHSGKRRYVFMTAWPGRVANLSFVRAGELGWSLHVHMYLLVAFNKVCTCLTKCDIDAFHALC